MRRQGSAGTGAGQSGGAVELELDPLRRALAALGRDAKAALMPRCVEVILTGALSQV